MDYAETLAWKLQLRTAVKNCSRSGYVLSSLSGAAGAGFLFLYIAPPMGAWLEGVFSHSRGWMPMLGIAIATLLLSSVGFWFTRKHAALLLNAIDEGAAISMQVRFVDRKETEDVRYEAWFDREANPRLGQTLMARVWSRYPQTVRPSLDISQPAQVLLCPRRATPIAMTIDEASFLFDEPAETQESPTND